MNGLLAIAGRVVGSRTVKGASAMGALFIAARAMTMGAQFIAGRALGPDEFGLANLIIATAAYLQIAFMLGFHTAISHFVAVEQDAEKRRTVVSTILAAFVCWTALVAVVFAVLQSPLATATSLPISSLRQSGGLALLLTVHAVLASVELGLRRFSARGAYEALYGFGTLTVFLVLLAGPNADHRALIAAMYCALGTTSLIMLARLRPLLTARLRMGLLPKALWYAVAASVNVFAAASVTAPARLTAHAAGGSSAIGVMSAYFVSSIQPALALALVLGSFIVPYASDPAGYERISGLARRYAIPAGLALFVVFLTASLAGLTIFGSRYPLRLDWSALFALAAVAHVAHTVGTSMLAARGLVALQLSVAGTIIAAAVTTGLSVSFVSRYGPGGGAAALIGGYLCSLCFLIWAFSARPASPAEKTIMAIE